VYLLIVTKMLLRLELKNEEQKGQIRSSCFDECEFFLEQSMVCRIIKEVTWRQCMLCTLSILYVIFICDVDVIYINKCVNRDFCQRICRSLL